MIVAALAKRADIALARIWLLRPGDICEKCVLREECPDQTSCLHLVASAGNPASTKADWSRIDGRFGRFPLGVRKIGHIAKSGRPVEVGDLTKETKWLADPKWADDEGIIGFGGQPLVFQGEVLGVIGVFTHRAFEREGSIWLRILADHASAAIANARAFEEIDRLRTQLELENEYLREEMSEEAAFGDIIGQSAPIRKIEEQIELVAATDTSVLILGESGTGKELVAREIHRRSPRADRPMIRVNCASIPKELYESEFFGHAKGAFTGAVKDRVGRFELADGGTLFLDEIGEIPLELQSKLLRVLQEGTFERVGEVRTREVDVRIVAATNRDLKAEAEAGRFRQDLYYRLAVFPIEVVPLRDRREDIPLLAQHFLDQFSRKVNCTPAPMTQANVLDLQAYDWPGNVRELQNIVERTVILSRCGALEFELPGQTPTLGTGLEGEFSSAVSLSIPVSTESHAAIPNGEAEVITESQMREREKANVVRALERSSWKVYGEGGAAELLGISPTTLSSRMKKMKIAKPR